MSKNEYIYAKRGQDTTRFGAMAWKMMSPKMKDGKSEGAWTQISEAEYAKRAKGNYGSGDTSKAANTTGAETEVKYRQLVEQAKGFTADGKHTDALAKLEEAKTLKPSGYITSLINKANIAIEAEAKAAAEAASAANADNGRANLVKVGTDALKSGDYETAVDMFTEAQEIEATDDVAKMIADAKERQEAADMAE